MCRLYANITPSSIRDLNTRAFTIHGRGWARVGVLESVSLGVMREVGTVFSFFHSSLVLLGFLLHFSWATWGGR